ncbi:multiple epidermal growth factor domains 10 [Biomphalaria glabrata]|nr:multiple epidermal growth factor domains 10 [Biomphalaria glabrata]
MDLHRNTPAFIVCLLCFQVAISQDGWFGPNNVFKCRCDPGCNLDGTCLNSGKCARGWFGLKCQHQDLTVLENTILSPNNNVLTDRDDTTCLSQPVTVTFNRTYVLTWLRLVVKDLALLPGFTIQFSKTTTATLKLECLNQKYFLVDNDTFDIQCDLPEAIQTVIITGIGQTSLCSLYINGGRSIALKQKTAQSSTYSDSHGTFDASKAVDGITNSDFFVGSCTHTAIGDTKPMWTVTFPLFEISRYVLYNRNEIMARLAGFVLVGENSGSQKFTYTDPSIPTTGLPVYIVVDPARNSLTQVKISTNEYLTLCETEIYGECPAGTYTSPDLQCTNCPVKCANICHQDSGLCYDCSGYSDPPNCNIGCSTGKYGINCTQACPTNCDNNECNPVTGLCLKCKPGFKGDSCDKECGDFFWGQNCSQRCSPNCQNYSCNNINGECFGGCSAGYTPPQCTQVCNAMTHGRNCSETCSRNCMDQKCDPVSGKCYVCIPGLKGEFCNQICNESTYGQNCSQACSNNCTDQKCDPVNGRCYQCVTGLTGDFCNQICAKDKWGPDCQINCTNNCFNLSCDRQTGKCDNGCDGFMDPPDCTVEWGHNCSNECDSRCKDKSCDRVTGLCVYVCDSLTNLSCPADCPSGYHGSNCTLKCSSTCKDQLCNGLGYCITCLPGHTGLYCENGLNSETGSCGLTFSSGVGIGVAVGAVVIILVVVVAIVVCRTRITTFRNRSNNDSQTTPQQRTYDSLKQMNEYSHSYETSKSTFEVKVKSDKKREQDDNRTIQYENTSNTVYETVG